MNSIELKKELLSMAEKQNRYNKEVCEGIINAIMAYYMQIADFYENNAIAIFKNFLESGVLSW